MKKFILICLFSLLILPLNASTYKQRVYVNLRSEGKETQFGVDNGTVSMYNSDSGVYLKCTVENGKIVKTVKLEKGVEQEPFVGTYGYCPFHTVKIYEEKK